MSRINQIKTHIQVIYDTEEVKRKSDVPTIEKFNLKLKVLT